MLSGQDELRGPLTPDEIERLAVQVTAFCNDPSGDSTMNLGGSMMMVRAGVRTLWTAGLCLHHILVSWRRK